MANEDTPRRGPQIVGWTVVSIFLAGMFFPILGAWTGAIMGAWFIGTQKPRRGFVWLAGINLCFGLIGHWQRFPLSLFPAAEYLGWMLVLSLIGALPFLFHRLVSPRLPGFWSTLPLPAAAVAVQSAAIAWLPPHVLPWFSMAGPGTALAVAWFGAAVVWMWNLDFRVGKMAGGAGIARHRKGWTCRPETAAILRSPYTGSPLHASPDAREYTTDSGERFAIRDGFPLLVKPEELTGSNRKYNHLYATIAGFYDDIQRVFCALAGMDRDEHFLRYLRLLEIKPGDSVLETSVGTGLNFKYLPRGTRLCGLDLSPEMLDRCRENLRRWQLDADLFIGNAEKLPFADASFDVVFHSGGINFFNDRAAAIREMIRVAKPGTPILIADETEQHVKEIYEKMPGYYNNRTEAVSAPVELVPADMLDVQVKILTKGRFYALTFRKPAAASHSSTI